LTYLWMILEPWWLRNTVLKLLVRLDESGAYCGDVHGVGMSSKCGVDR
jgi:hypothetical protein